MNPHLSSHYLIVIAILVTSLIVSGCSGSSTPQSQVGTQSASANDPAIEPGESDPETMTGVPDPMMQNSVQVEFDITVPRYASNALKVTVLWGDKNINASWVGDEYWSASDDFPTNTEQLLSVTFYDKNGAVVLGTHERNYKTGTNASETYSISADEFETESWDVDGDGVSNLDESRAGTDPLTNEMAADAELPVKQWLDQHGLTAIGVIRDSSDLYEASIPGDRPYFEYLEEIVPWEFDENWTLTNTKKRTIDLDASGTGTYSTYTRTEFNPSDHTSVTESGTRTNTGSSIIWTGTYNRYQRESVVSTDIDFGLETRNIDAQTRFQTGEFKWSYTNSSSSGISINYTLTGKPVEDSSMCEAVSGTITYFGSRYKVSKNVDDPLWRATVFDGAGQITEEYFVDPLKPQFFCEFSDLP